MSSFILKKKIHIDVFKNAYAYIIFYNHNYYHNCKVSAIIIMSYLNYSRYIFYNLKYC